MSVWDNIKQVVVQPIAREVARMQASARFVEAAGKVVDSDLAGFTQIGGQRRDVLFNDKVEAIEDIIRLYQRSPLCKWLLEMMRDLILAEGVTVESTNEDVQGIIDQFWNHPVNNFNMNLPLIVLELFLYGEQALPAFPGPQGGTVVVGSIDPSDIFKVIHDPNNVVMPIGLEKGIDGAEGFRRYGVIYNGVDTDIFSDEAVRIRASEFNETQAFWFKMNGLRHQSRGRSEVYAWIDILKMYEMQVMNIMDRVSLFNSLQWDVTISGASDAEIKKWIQDHPQPPSPGSQFVHNEKIAMEPKTPDLQSFDMSEFLRSSRNHLLGAASLPEHFYGGASDVNRATAQEMTLPTFKRYRAKQLMVHGLIDQMVEFQLRHAASAGLIPIEETTNFKTTMPLISTDDFKQVTESLKDITAGLMIAQEQGWINEDQARALFSVIAERTGVDLAITDETMGEDVVAESIRKQYDDKLRAIRATA